MGGPETRLGFLDLLLIVWFSGTPGDAHSLSYNFTVDLQPGRRQLWCEVQGQVDGEVFLSYDCGHAKIIFTSLLGEEVKTIKAWEIQVETLRDIRDWIKDQLHDFTLEKRMARDPLTLQARMACRCEDDRHISGSWQFGLNGQMSLHFDLENGHWRVDHPGGRWMKEKWESDRAVTDFLKKVSMGDCRAWLQAFMVRWEEMLKTTVSEKGGESDPPLMVTWTHSRVCVCVCVCVCLRKGSIGR
uniref:MHC class I-like antigen recognition-like domain-containing protein n=1 Tax=Capra hircus TaxID=9925 RepID=A0A452EJZ6_CAPHI